jgi:hypothetical protein
MPRYTFVLKDGSADAIQDIGIDLPNQEEAFRYARDVVHELMRGCEPRTRAWRLDAYDGGGKPIFEIPFARVDHTLDHMRAELRAKIEQVCDRKRALMEAIEAARNTVYEARAAVARSRGEPYLASRGGRRTIRAPLGRMPA